MRPAESGDPPFVYRAPWSPAARAFEFEPDCGSVFKPTPIKTDIPPGRPEAVGSTNDP